MTLRAALERILVEGRGARDEGLAGHPVAQFIRHDAAREVEGARTDSSREPRSWPMGRCAVDFRL